MSGDLGVFVVRVETTGLWEADCNNERCCYGVHAVAEDLGSKAAAERAATAHRKHLRRLIAEETARGDKAARPAESGDVLRWRRAAKRVEAERGVYRAAFAGLLDLVEAHMGDPEAAVAAIEERLRGVPDEVERVLDEFDGPNREVP